MWVGVGTSQPAQERFGGMGNVLHCVVLGFLATERPVMPGDGAQGG